MDQINDKTVALNQFLIIFILVEYFNLKFNNGMLSNVWKLS